jgi:hypothetical protein
MFYELLSILKEKLSISKSYKVLVRDIKYY